MPLVGVDWSQTGVTHLFSAIKVNFTSYFLFIFIGVQFSYYVCQFILHTINFVSFDMSEGSFVARLRSRL